MCYRPIHIYNPSRRYNLDAPLKIAVPCGHCADCQRIMQNEWFFRSYQEFKYYRSIGGTCYFVTLTYNDDNVPSMVLPDGQKQLCFNKSHIRNFVKYMRIWLKRHNYPSDGIRFLICSEYGSETSRPHYHGLLFFPYHLNFWSDKIKPEDKVTRLAGSVHHKSPFEHFITSTWTKGFVVCSKLGWEIKDISGIRYAAKYVGKDFTFYNLPSLRSNFNFKADEMKIFQKENYDCFPHHYQSVGYGERFIDEINKQTDIPKYLAKNSVNLWSGSDGTFPIPRYYHIKMEKYINKEYSKLLDKVVIERSEIGTKVKEIRLHECVLKDMANLRTITSDYIQKSLPNTLIFNSQYNYLHDNCKNLSIRLEDIFAKKIHSFIHYEDVRQYLTSALPSKLAQIDLHKLSLYRCFLRYTPILEEEVPEHKFVEISDMIKNILYPSVYPPEYEDVIVPSGLSEFAKPLSDNPHLHHVQLCKDNPYFSEYEELCKMLDYFSIVSGITKEFNSLYNQYRNKKCKNSKGSKPYIYKSLNN